MKKGFLSFIMVIVMCLGFAVPMMAEQGETVAIYLPEGFDEAAVFSLSNVIRVEEITYFEFDGQTWPTQGQRFFVNAPATLTHLQDVWIYEEGWHEEGWTEGGVYGNGGRGRIPLTTGTTTQETVVWEGINATSIFYINPTGSTIVLTEGIYSISVGPIDYMIRIVVENNEENQIPAPTPTPAPTATDGIGVLIDGVPLEMDVTPIIRNDRTLVPVRAIVEALGADIGWNNDTREVTISQGSQSIIMTIDSTTVTFVHADGREENAELDVAPIIVDDRTMLPIRFLAEAFGFEVDWDNENQNVIIATQQ